MATRAREQPISQDEGSRADPGTATQSALVVPVPDVEYLVGEFRARLDDAAALGVPAHVTVISPFVPPGELTAEVLAALGQTVSSVGAFDVTFAGVSWFGEQVLWLAPTPADPFRRLTAAVWERFPAHPPYQGAHDDVVPHLTIGHSQPIETLRAAASSVSAQLPVSARASVAWLLQGSDAAGSWHKIAEFPLGVAA
jgi:2'-5' RNA ligase